MGKIWGPRLFLLLSAPILVDLLFGAVQLDTLAALVPTVLTYGCATLLLRGVARFRGTGWPAMLCWGVAFALIAEGLIVQTSLAPITGLGGPWGRAAGVNWSYLVWALGYECGWAVGLSIQLTELVFPARRDQPWLSGRGIAIVAIIYLLGAVPTWYNWTQIVAPRLTGQPIYQPPLHLAALAALFSVLLLALGWLLSARPRAKATSAGKVPAPVFVGGAAFVAGLAWFALLVPSADPVLVRLPAALPIGLALLLAAMTVVIGRRWSLAVAWSDRHRLAVVAGALLAGMIAGFPANQPTGVNLLGKIVLDALAMAGVVLLAANRRSAAARHRDLPAES